VDYKAGRKLFGLVKGSGLKLNLQLAVRGTADGLLLFNIFSMMEQNDTKLVEIAEGQSGCSEGL